jgi:hypothetical protein
MLKTTLTPEKVNTLLNQLTHIPYRVALIPSKGKYNLMKGTRPDYQGSLHHCLKYAQGQIEIFNYYEEVRAIEKLHLFCYLPHVTYRTERSYPPG